jgi:DNA-binding transcriptional ArsR family regulator
MARSHASAVELRATLRVFALFGHPLRVVIFQRLARAPQSAGELAHTLPVSRSAVVQHLKRMQSARLVRAARAGRRLVYRIDPSGLAPLVRWLQRQLTAAGARRS